MTRIMTCACATLLVMLIAQGAGATQRVPNIPLAIGIPERFVRASVDTQPERNGVRRIAVYRDVSSGSSIGITMRTVPQFLTVEEVIKFLRFDRGQQYSEKRVVSSCGRKIGFLEGSGIVGTRPSNFMEAFYVVHDSASNVVYTVAYSYPGSRPERDAVAAITCG